MLNFWARLIRFCMKYNNIIDLSGTLQPFMAVLPEVRAYFLMPGADSAPYKLTDYWTTSETNPSPD